MMSPERLSYWLSERKFKREQLPDTLRLHGMKPDEGYKMKWDSWCRIWRRRHWDPKRRGWI